MATNTRSKDTSIKSGKLGASGKTETNGFHPVNGTAETTNGTDRDYSRVYETLGVTFINRSGEEALAEECPFCGKDRFYVNTPTGIYHCKHCETSGNVKTFLTHYHQQTLGRTTSKDYLALKKLRGGKIAAQTFKRHQLAYDSALGCWLIPFQNDKGTIVNLQLYYPNRSKPNKMNLPCLPTSLYGFHRLRTSSKEKPVLLCEGPFDAIALDYNIGPQHRSRYILLATPGGFKKEWAELFQGHKVYAFYDNDAGGQRHRESVQKLLGESGLADELNLLKWPDQVPKGYDLQDLVCDRRFGDGAEKSLLSFLFENCVEIAAESILDFKHGWEHEPNTGPEKIDWVWPNRMRCGSYVSLSGRRGTLKSTLIRELIARYTQEIPLPDCEKIGLPASHTIYLTAEDGAAAAWAHFDLAKANRNYLSVLPAIGKDGNMLNILEHLDELERTIRLYGSRLVVIDGQNSVVGAPCIATDILARHNITNRLHQFAQRHNICLVGVRNEDEGGRAYGPASMSDLGRCILRTEELKADRDQRYFVLQFPRISDAAPKTHPPLYYSVEDLGGSSRRILWNRQNPKSDGEAFQKAMDARHTEK